MSKRERAKQMKLHGRWMGLMNGRPERVRRKARALRVKLGYEEAIRFLEGVRS